ncbi:MAG TPA: hypothetical protein PLB76_12725, partial [Anaerohalosphaeraceae bacterium]|nr:hypothetical protein [Anaerohalosphaeraceae bacterium]
RLEQKTIAKLSAAGYLCIRSAGSQGPFDVLALSPLGIRCIQVKSNDWPRPEEREGLRMAALGLPSNARIECWRWNDNAREPIIKRLEELPL